MAIVRVESKDRITYADGEMVLTLFKTVPAKIRLDTPLTAANVGMDLTWETADARVVAANRIKAV